MPVITINGTPRNISPGAHLGSADLHGADLHDADLHGAYLYRADLHGAYLYRADLHGADLHGADLHGTDLSRADLHGADLHGTDLSGADLHGADLRVANLRVADLHGADLYGTDLSGADLSGANLSGADLSGAYLSRAYLPEELRGMLSIIPAGDVTGWKKCRYGVIVKLMIPASARRSNTTSRKCRAEYADVLEVTGAETGISRHDHSFTYQAGERVRARSFDPNWAVECGGGIHFFLTRQEAENYD